MLASSVESRILARIGTFLSKILVKAHRLREKTVQDTNSEDKSLTPVFLIFFRERSNVMINIRVHIETTIKIIRRNFFGIIVLI